MPSAGTWQRYASCEDGLRQGLLPMLRTWRDMGTQPYAVVLDMDDTVVRTNEETEREEPVPWLDALLDALNHDGRDENMSVVIVTARPLGQEQDTIEQFRAVTGWDIPIAQVLCREEGARDADELKDAAQFKYDGRCWADKVHAPVAATVGDQWWDVCCPTEEAENADSDLFDDDHTYVRTDRNLCTCVKLGTC